MFFSDYITAQKGRKPSPAFIADNGPLSGVALFVAGGDKNFFPLREETVQFGELKLQVRQKDFFQDHRKRNCQHDRSHDIREMMGPKSNARP